jgi:alkylmercury lyase
MTDDIFQRLSEAMICTSGAEHLTSLLPPLLHLLAEGAPVPPERLAIAVGKPLLEVKSALREVPGPVEFDREGRIVGWGLTLRPTEHRVEVEGHTLYTWCAEETLVFPIILGKRFRVTSPCYQTGEPIRVEVDPMRVERVEPKSAVVSVLFPLENLSRDTACAHGHYFSSPKAATAWLDQYSNAQNLEVEIVPVHKAFESGRRHVQRLHLV